MDKPTPPSTRLHSKIKHLPLESQKKVLDVLRKLAPKNNDEAMKHKMQAKLAAKA